MNLRIYNFISQLSVKICEKYVFMTEHVKSNNAHFTANHTKLIYHGTVKLYIICMKF